jgi:hypothetical protein
MFLTSCHTLHALVNYKKKKEMKKLFLFAAAAIAIAFAFKTSTSNGVVGSIGLASGYCFILIPGAFLRPPKEYVKKQEDWSGGVHFITFTNGDKGYYFLNKTNLPVVKEKDGKLHRVTRIPVNLIKPHHIQKMRIRVAA